MSKILFVIPPYRTTDHLVAQLYPMPYGAVILGTILKQAGHEVVIKDFLLPAEKSKAAAPASFKGLGMHPAYMHFGLPMVDVLEWIRSTAPRFDMVLLAFQQCNLYETGEMIAKEVKRLGLPLMVGGAFATTAPDQVLSLTGADILIKGEAEEVILDAVAHLEAGYKGIIEGTIVDITKTPLPDWSLAPPANYPAYNGKIRGVVCISRGCPWDCKFCSVRTIASRKHRRLDRSQIKEQLINLYRQNVRYICFLDDNLFISKQAITDLLTVIDELDAALPDFKKIRFYVEEGMEIRIAAESGILQSIFSHRFDNVALGLESMNDKRRADQSKPYKQLDLEKAISELSKIRGETAKAFYIIGFPGDTIQSVAADLIEFGKLGLAARPNNLKLYPGTDIAKLYLENGWIDAAYDWRLSSWHTPNSGTLSMGDIRRLKTILGAIGKAADDFKAALFADDIDSLINKFEQGKYRLTRNDQGVITIKGNMFRDTPYRHMAELLALRFGAKGVITKIQDDTVIATPLDAPADDIQAAIVKALRPEEALPVPAPYQWKTPNWILGDAVELDRLLPADRQYDFVFSCPPYHDLEQYSEDPKDLSNMSWADFALAYKAAINQAVARLRDNRFACFVVGEIREPDKGGFYKGLISLTVEAFEAAGARFYNDMILVTAIGSLPIRVGKQFTGNRKIGKTHQNILVFYKGNPAKIKELFPDYVPNADLSIFTDQPPIEEGENV